MKNLIDIRNNVSVEAHGGFAVITVSESSYYILRLLGASCSTDMDLYVPTKRITLSLQKGKRGVIAFSLSTLDGRLHSRELFEVTWRGQDEDKIYINLSKPFSSILKNGSSVSDKGFDICVGSLHYHLSSAFWGDAEYYHTEGEVSHHLQGLKCSGWKLFRDGNAFCSYLVSDADINDIEASHMEYCMEDRYFRKQIAKEVVILRKEVKPTTENLDKINNLEVELGKTVNALVYIKSILSRPWMTWWKKLSCISTVFNPKHNRYVGVNLE